jgi:hypothetical protein
MNFADEKKPVVPKNPLKPVLLSLLILFSGILIGAGLTYISMQRHIPSQPEPGPEYFSERMMRHLAGELQLTDEQKAQLEPVIETHFQSMNQIRMEARPRISEEIKQMNEAIMAILTEPQKQIWEDRVKRIREVFPREGFGPGRGPGGRRRGPDGDERRPDGRPGDDDRDRRRPWRDDPNRPGRDDWRRPEPATGPVPMDEPGFPDAF